MSRIVKSGQIVLNKEKFKLSPFIIPSVNDEFEEDLDDTYELGEEEKPKKVEIDIESIIEDAKVRADEILQTAVQEKEKILKDAYDDGMEIMESSKREGYDKGFSDGYNDGTKEAEKIIIEANKIKKDAVKKYKDYHLDSEEVLISLVLEVCEKILNDTVEEKKSYVFSLVKKSLEKITQTETLKIRVSEHDYINLISMKNQILPLLDRVDDVQIVQDPSIAKGAVFLETDKGNIDGSIWTQFQEVKSRFEELIKSE